MRSASRSVGLRACQSDGVQAVTPRHCGRPGEWDSEETGSEESGSEAEEGGEEAADADDRKVPALQ